MAGKVAPERYQSFRNMLAATPMTNFAGMNFERVAIAPLRPPTITDGDDLAASSALKVAEMTSEIGARPPEGFAPATLKKFVAVAPGLTARTRTPVFLVSPQTAEVNDKTNALVAA